ncbi:nuclear transport factor 2 family protein [Algoriphagus sp.]|uniref:nuclear transport factor 2 family protein n=1 Tax=Algoriphagus sp. TaxID=1872435 RepID=UPI003273422F
MKINLILLLFVISFNSFSQETNQQEIAAVEHVVNRFFESLEKQDTLLLQEVAFMEGQIWTVNHTVSPARRRMRFFRDDLKSFTSKNSYLETAKSMEVKIHKEMAMAWVPYEFRMNGDFSHCGVDVFTLVKAEGNWKIINLSYTIDKEGCTSK